MSFIRREQCTGNLGMEIANIIRPTPVNAFMRPCPRITVVAVVHQSFYACGPNYTIAVVFHAFAGRYSIFLGEI